jgi:Cys-tRNA(Pro) deacylase
MSDLLNKEPVRRVQKKLKEFDESYKVIELDSSARTAKEAAESLKTDVGSIVKSLLFRSQNNFFLCLVSGDKRCSLNKLKKIKNLKDISMANPQSVKEVTGFTIGGVSPIGHLEKIEIFIDNNLKRFEKIYAAAGHPHCVYKIDFENLIKITNGTVMDIAE